MDPRYPLYVISKGRWESRLTSKILEKMCVSYHIVVEEQEREAYAAVIDPSKILVLDPAYQDAYDTCDDLGDTKSKGSGAARNFVWDHSMDRGFGRHWIMDDNIRFFCRYQKNLKAPAADGTVFRCMEDFVERYENVVMAGPQYYMFVSRKHGHYPPFVLNTRIYSCNLILNSAPYRWRGRYNEDTILSLDMLKDGWCTMLFNAFLQYKMTTQQMKGGNTDTIYVDGTLEKSRMLARLHPDVAQVIWRFGRWHHYVDYRPFKRNILRRKKGLEPPKGADEYGMVLQRVEA